MKVITKQRNSRMCVICGLDNNSGLKAPFYSMQDGSVVTLFKYAEHHQSYPGRVHGGLIASMVDEMGLRGIWANHGAEDEWGVTTSLEMKYRKPVPYGVELLGRGEVIKDSNLSFVVHASIFSREGILLAEGKTTYLKIPVSKISSAEVHEEMCYLIDDGITDIDF